MTTSKAQLLTARILAGLSISFLLFDSIIKLLELPTAITATLELGYPASAVFAIGLIELACIALYAIPRTSLLGAVLLNGYLGGAIASQVRVGNPLLSHVLFPTYVAAMLWGSLYLRDVRLRILLPIGAPL